MVLLQHLASRFGQLCRKETTCSEGAGGEQDGHGLGDADEWLEDADAQDGRQLTEGVQEAEGCAPTHTERTNTVRQKFNKEGFLDYIYSLSFGLITLGMTQKSYCAACSVQSNAF